MAIESSDGFYRTYSAFKRYRTPTLKPKHVRWFDREVWAPGRFTPATSVLELGSGTGDFLDYLKHKGVKRFLGVERDREAIAAMPPGLEAHVHVGDMRAFIDGGSLGDGPFDRVVMLDVLEHFDAVEAARLLENIRESVLAPDGMVVVRVPNMGSPWGASHQFSDLTHRAAFTAGSLDQLAIAAGYETVAVVAQRRGAPFRQVAECCLHWILSKVLTAPPAVWSANIIAVFRPRRSA